MSGGGGILTEAIEAAHAAICEQNLDDCMDPDWRGRCVKAVEAAAPHMLASAWAEGAQAGFDSTAEGFNGECAFDHCAPDNYPPTNPYSGEKWEVADWEPTT